MPVCRPAHSMASMSAQGYESPRHHYYNRNSNSTYSRDDFPQRHRSSSASIPIPGSRDIPEDTVMVRFLHAPAPCPCCRFDSSCVRVFACECLYLRTLTNSMQAASLGCVCAFPVPFPCLSLTRLFLSPRTRASRGPLTRRMGATCTLKPPRLTMGGPSVAPSRPRALCRPLRRRHASGQKARTRRALHHIRRQDTRPWTTAVCLVFHQCLVREFRKVACHWRFVLRRDQSKTPIPLAFLCRRYGARQSRQRQPAAQAVWIHAVRSRRAWEAGQPKEGETQRKREEAARRDEVVLRKPCPDSSRTDALSAGMALSLRASCSSQQQLLLNLR
jgi:hypothetical protein